MKTTELRPCVICGGKVAPIFYMVRVQQTLIDHNAVNQVLGLNTMFGGDALRLAEVMSPSGDNVTDVMQEDECPVCQECFFEKPVTAVLFEEARHEANND